MQESDDQMSTSRLADTSLANLTLNTSRQPASASFSGKKKTGFTFKLHFWAIRSNCYSLLQLQNWQVAATPPSWSSLCVWPHSRGPAEEEQHLPMTSQPDSTWSKGHLMSTEVESYLNSFCHRDSNRQHAELSHRPNQGHPLLTGTRVTTLSNLKSF